jgi:hypothetical protein
MSTHLHATWHTDLLDMVVLHSTGASRYHNCYIDGVTSPEYFGILPRINKLEISEHIFEKFSNTKFREILCSGSQVPFVRTTDRQTWRN